MKFGSLFTGIGGIDLGLERAGWECAFQVEVDEKCVRILEKNWPEIPRFRDVTRVRASDLPRVRALVGGFPCQDISQAHSNGVRRFLSGRRSGLFYEFARIIEEVGPRWVVAENVPNLWMRWLPDVRAELWRIGYATLPMELSAGSFGAPHVRPRLVVVAYADRDCEPLRALYEEVACLRPLPIRSGHWRAPPSRGFRMDDGVPGGMDRCGMLGNSAVPQVFEWLGERIREIDHDY